MVEWKLFMRGFKDNLKLSIHRYFMDYGYEKFVDKIDDIKTPTGLIKYFFRIAKDDSIYLLIDEYDQFCKCYISS